MTKRILFGAIMIIVLGALLMLDWRLEHQFGRGLVRFSPTAVLLLVVSIAGFMEFSRLAEASGAKLLKLSGSIAAAALATSPYWGRLLRLLVPPPSFGFAHMPSGFLLLLGLAILGVFVEQMIRYRTENGLVNIGATLLGVLYLGVGGALIFLIRGSGIKPLVLFLVAVKCTDIGAYFTGSAIGKHKIIPWLSPGKSWEGLAGGLVVSAAATVLAAWALAVHPSVALWHWGVFAIVVGLAGQFGDLCESLLKRSAKLKDSGAIVPEFGGLLDIIDSPLLAAPVAILALAIIY